mgnify:CR=1 FL=1
MISDSVAKKSTERRIVAVLTAFAIFGCFLLYNVLRLDYFGYDYYRNKTYDQVTTSSALKAERGAIFDSNMNILAATKTEWRIFISTRDIKKAEKESGIDYSEIIADGLAAILSLDGDTLLKKIKESNVLDVTIKRSATEEEYRRVLDFIIDNSLERLVFTEAKSTRYYPESTLAAHVLGFTGSDSQGLYGLEYYYDDLLSGTDGYYVYAKDANGNALSTEYSSYFPAENGYSLVTTLDSYVQSELEAILETVRVNHAVNNRVTGVVMDTSTGAILAMATTSPFDPNDPFTLDSVSAEKLAASGLAPGSDEYNKYKRELTEIMWSNKAVSETYEPGSTFKIVTVSAALDSGVAKPSDTFSCNGSVSVGGWTIRCHKRTGHGGGFSLGYGLQMSCNPCMIALSERIGAERFYDYVERFGYFEKTGIDLPSEASTIFHSEDALGTVELATSSFGQRFKVTIISQLAAVAAVANGGYLVTPYVVDKVIDSEGNIVSDRGTTVKRRVISEDVANTVSKILIEGVSGDGGAKNAGVAGYDVAAKTGTSQKFDILDENGNSYLRIGSTVAYSVDGDRGIAVIIVVDEPTTSVKYGSVVAAPYVSALLERTLPYLEYKSSAESVNIALDSFVGMNINSATAKLKEANILYEIVGDGDVVLAQTPGGGDVITYPLSKVILYTEDTEDEYVTVPSVTGLDMPAAIREIINSGLNISFSGVSGIYPDSLDKIVEQSIPPGTRVKRGTVITLRAINCDFED